ncbi:MAG: TIM44-like domain-containing protein [Planctomycetes bacterium]|nr:TIM44-like domain-containing protein [Planctomycetota bacterium]
MRRRFYIWLLVLTPLLVLLAGELMARAGGGGGYSGGGGGGGGGSGGGGGGGGGGGDLAALIWIVFKLFELLFWLWQSGPVGKVIAILIVVGIIAGIVYWWRKPALNARELRGRGQILESAAGSQSRRDAMAAIKRADPNFSRVMFLDFAHLVYVKLHESRGGVAKSAVMPYLAEGLRERIKQDPAQVREVIVGALKIVRSGATQDASRIVVEYKSNVVTEEGGQRVRLYLEQRLSFVRPVGVITQPPEKTLALGCPNCGSAEEPGVDGKCPSCGSVTGRGEMSWQVKALETMVTRRVPEALPDSGGVEAGTLAPTVFSGDLNAQLRELRMRDGGFTLEAFTGRVRHIFTEIQAGWSAVDESRLRPYETNTLFDSHRFWLERYRQEGKRNVIDDLVVDRIQLAKFEHDAFFDAATVRIFASCKDYTVDSKGSVLSGNKSQARKFSEYWTLVRRSDESVKPSGDPSKCPKCGAPLDKVNRAGVCEYCNSLIVNGKFDWVAAIIEQDEEYVG